MCRVCARLKFGAGEHLPRTQKTFSYVERTFFTDELIMSKDSIEKIKAGVLLLF